MRTTSTQRTAPNSSPSCPEAPRPHQPADTHQPDWRVLLIGGPSGAGKSTVAERIARRHGATWLMVDDLRLALQRSRVTLPTPEATAALHFDKTPGWWSLPPERLRDAAIAVGEALSPALEVVIENHVDQRYPVVIEGDGILPSLFERASVRARNTNGRIRTVYLYEPDGDALYANFLARGRDGWRGNLRAHARKHALYGEWLTQEAEQRGLSTVPARPWDTLVDRILAAAGLSHHAREANAHPTTQD